MSEAVMFIGGPESTRRLYAHEVHLMPISLYKTFVCVFQTIHSELICLKWFSGQTRIMIIGKLGYPKHRFYAERLLFFC